MQSGADRDKSAFQLAQELREQQARRGVSSPAQAEEEKGEDDRAETLVRVAPPRRAAEARPGGRAANKPGSTRALAQIVYIDADLDDAIITISGTFIPGTRRKPSRSLSAYYLMMLGVAEWERQGRPALPRDLSKRRP
jgi:hypothetical protein